MCKEQTIPFPCSALYGVSVRIDGSLENIGIGILETDDAKKVADCLNRLAEAILLAAGRRS